MSLRSLLRQETRAEHDGLEALLALDATGLTRPRYGRFVVCAHAFHAGMEPALERNPLARWGLDMRERVKRPWLAADLQYLGLPPGMPVEDEDAGDAALLGRAYVLEGATLGGRVLLDRVAATCDVSPGRGASYLAGYEGRTAAMWKSFVAALEQVALDESGTRACIEGARRTFRRYEALLRDNGWS